MREAPDETAMPALVRLEHAVKRRKADVIWCAFVIGPPPPPPPRRRDTTQKLFLVGQRR